jgi:UDP-N-acetylmuramoylalanine-D-glutamate ligase
LDYTPQLLTQSLKTRPRCSKSSNISKLAQANHIPHVVLIGQSAKELGNNIHTAKVTYTNSMEAAVNVASKTKK